MGEETGICAFFVDGLPFTWFEGFGGRRGMRIRMEMMSILVGNRIWE